MKLLETVPQDIKINRDFRPCAPSFYRWIVVGAYGLLLLSAIFYLGVKIWNTQTLLVSKSQRNQLDELNSQIASIRAQGNQLTLLHTQYNKTQNWLRGNYSIEGVLSTIFAALPPRARILEMILSNTTGSSREFLLKIKLFPSSGAVVPSFSSMEEELQQKGFLLREPPNAPDGLIDNDYSMLIILPSSFFPHANVQDSSADADPEVPLP